MTVPLTSCLTGLDQSVLQIKTKIVSCHAAYPKPVKQEVNGTVILHLLVFPGQRQNGTTCFILLLDIEGATEKLSQLIMPPRSKFNKLREVLSCVFIGEVYCNNAHNIGPSLLALATLGSVTLNRNDPICVHRYQNYLNRLLKVCYLSATSMVLTVFFSSFFLLWPLTVLMKQTRQPVHAMKQSIYLDVYDLCHTAQGGCGKYNSVDIQVQQ